MDSNQLTIRLGKYGPGLATVLILLTVLLWPSNHPEESGSLHISLVETHDTPSGREAKLRLQNVSDKKTIRINAYCTLYWENSIGQEEHKFHKLESGFVVFHPGDDMLLNIPYPTKTGSWRSSFSYETRPDFFKRMLNWIKLQAGGKWQPNNSFRGAIGPVVSDEPRLSTNNHPGTNFLLKSIPATVP